MRGTSAIAGHRNTYGAPFRNLDRVRSGDRVRIEMPYGVFAYRVERVRVVDPAALWVIRTARYDRLVLSACHPLFSSAERIVVLARLEQVVPGMGARLRASHWTTVGLSSSPGQRHP
jgi:sortase A